MTGTVVQSAGVGRPKAASRQLIEDAATELFLENTYAGTTIDQITTRAGVSRATFFNYFGAKSDLLWFEVDRAIDSLGEACRLAAPAASIATLRSVLLGIVNDFDERRVPVALTQHEVMGATDEVLQSGLLRVARQAAVFGAFISACHDRPPSDMLVRVAGNAFAGAVTAAWVAWARAGIGRSPLDGYIATAVDAILPGLEAALAGERRE
jgi:AcrR family transcriptional regulator